MPVTVTNLDDAGPGSLRQAILDAAPGEVVDFEEGLSGTITLTTGELLIRKDLVISGPSAFVMAVSGNNQSRVFNVAAGANVELYGLTIRNGSVTAAGATAGGILNAGNLLLYGSSVISNRTRAPAPPPSGASASAGGIRNTGNLIMLYTTVGDNSTSASGVSSGNSQGGGIVNTGTLVIEDSVVSGNTSSATGNQSSSSAGAGIYNTGELFVSRSILRDNTVSGGGGSAGGSGIGGGIDNRGTAIVVDSTISGNTARSNGVSSGGGIAAGLRSSTTVSNSTLSGNRSDSTRPTQGAANGGGLMATSESQVWILNSTITNNTLTGFASATLRGGGVFVISSSSTALHNTLVAGNQGRQAPDFWGPVASAGHNLIGDGSDSSGFLDTDLVGTAEAPIDPLLGPLEDNGGATPTHALLPGSPALDAGDPTDAPEFDQRGDGFFRVVGDNIDIGAFEYQGEGGSPGAGPLEPAFTPLPVETMGPDAAGLLLRLSTRRGLSAEG